MVQCIVQYIVQCAVWYAVKCIAQCALRCVVQYLVQCFIHCTVQRIVQGSLQCIVECTVKYCSTVVHHCTVCSTVVHTVGVGQRRQMSVILGGAEILFSDTRD